MHTVASDIVKVLNRSKRAKHLKCMRCYGLFVSEHEIYCPKCYKQLHLEWCHPDTMICDCEEKEG